MPAVISGRQSVGTSKVKSVEVDSEIGGLAARQYIWNTSSLAWEKATGSSGAGSVTVTNFPATQNVDIVAQSIGNLDTVIKQPLPPALGSLSKASVALASANTWYAVPSGTPPSADYLLIVAKESYAGVIRWSLSNSGTPGVTNGIRLGKYTAVIMEASSVIYCSSSIAGDDVNYETKELI